MYICPKIQNFPPSSALKYMFHILHKYDLKMALLLFPTLLPKVKKSETTLQWENSDYHPDFAPTKTGGGVVNLGGARKMLDRTQQYGVVVQI